jgi:DNA helicase-2/ATP-dependent DNA helicase PcrA
MQGELNEAQRAAVSHKDGALLILAGAGAGKTRVVVHRIAELIRQGVRPEKILAVTFTNKAANEMKSRIAALTGADFTLSPYDSPRTHPFISTFHVLCLHIIRTFHADAGLPARFTIYDRSDSSRAAKEAIIGAGFDPKELEPRRVISAMSRAKGEALSSAEFRDRSASYIDEAIAEVWKRYDVILATENALDFDDILLRAQTLLATKPAVREHFQNAWEYLHVDEYQDTNGVQYEIVRALSSKHGNIAVVGDADQNIYSWRGASLEHIMNFERDFPEATVVVLTENYRSTKTILTAANDAIAKNVRRKEKVLTTQNDGGDPIAVAALPDEVGEGGYVAHECARLIRDGRAPEDIAVLYRANFQSRVLEEAFLRAGIAYQVLGTRFFERKEVKDALSYLKLVIVGDSAADLARALATPARGLGKVALAKVLSGRESELPEGQRQKVTAFRAALERMRARASTTPASEAVRYALHESGLWQLYEQGRGEDEERLENLKELVSVATKYDALPPEEGIARLLDEAALQSDQDELDSPSYAKASEGKAGVKLMTVHAAKGLEFPVVFITGLEAGLFPHERDDNPPAGGGDDEEERRLFYVALTRAEKKAYLTFALSRRIFGTRSINVPSEFITEMDPALVEVVPARDTYEEEIP